MMKFTKIIKQYNSLNPFYNLNQLESFSNKNNASIFSAKNNMYTKKFVHYNFNYSNMVFRL